MRPVVRDVLCALAFAAAMAPSAARGQNGAGERPHAPERAGDRAAREAQARFAEGIERVRAGKYEAARVKFAQAYAVLRRPDILWNLALAEDKSGRALDALAHFKQLSRDAEAAGDRERVNKHVDALMARTAHIEVQAPAGTAIVMDGAQRVGVAPLAEAIDVEAGRHVVEAALAQGAKSIAVDAQNGRVTQVSFVAEAQPIAPAPAAAIGTSGASDQAAQQQQQQQQRAQPEAPAQPPAQGASSSSARVATVLVLAGAAAAAAGAGVLFGIESQSDSDTAARFRANSPPNACVGSTSDPCRQWSDTVDAQNREHTLSVASWIGAGALAAGAAGAWLLWPRNARAAAAVVVPVVGPEGGGAALRASF